jgi:hypothetical protein
MLDNEYVSFSGVIFDSFASSNGYAVFDTTKGSAGYNQGIGINCNPVQTADLACSFGLNVRSVASAYTVDSNDHTLLLSGGPYAITLPTPTVRRRLALKARDASAVAYTIAPHAAETIDGAGGYVMAGKQEAIELTSDGTNWFTVGSSNQLTNELTWASDLAGSTNTSQKVVSAQNGKYTFDPGGGRINFNGSTSAASASLLSDGTSFSYVNAPLGGALGLLLNDSIFAQYTTSTNTFWGSFGASLAYEYLDVGPTAKFHFGVLATTATVVVDPKTTDASTIPLTLQGQSALPAATTNRSGGGVIVAPGAGATTNGSPGGFTVSLGVPSGTGNQSYSSVTYGGAQVFATGNQAGRGGVWLGSPSPTGANFALIGDGTSFTDLNTVSGGFIGMLFGGATYGAAFFSGGLQVGGATASFGNGSGGILGITNATTAPTAPTSGGAALWSDSIGLHFDGASPSFTDYVIAPVSQGTVNSQQAKFRSYAGFARATSTTAVTILTIPLSTAGTIASIRLCISGRSVSGGTTGDSYSYFNVVGFKNVGGIVTAATTQGTANVAKDASATFAAPSFTISGTNILVKITSLASVTWDFSAEADVVIT